MDYFSEAIGEMIGIEIAAALAAQSASMIVKLEYLLTPLTHLLAVTDQ